MTGPSVPFAPYESVPDDDLGSAAAATIGFGLAALLAVSLGTQVWNQVPDVRRAMSSAELQGQELATVVTTVGWGAAAVLLGLGALLLIVHRGRGLLVLGGLIATAVTAVARYSFGWFTAEHPLSNPLVFWGGVLVVVVAALPATGRWVHSRRRSRSMPALTTAAPVALTTTATGIISTLGPAGGTGIRPPR